MLEEKGAPRTRPRLREGAPRSRLHAREKKMTGGILRGRRRPAVGGPTWRSGERVALAGKDVGVGLTRALPLISVGGHSAPLRFSAGGGPQRGADPFPRPVSSVFQCPVREVEPDNPPKAQASPVPHWVVFSATGATLWIGARIRQLGWCPRLHDIRRAQLSLMIASAAAVCPSGCVGEKEESRWTRHSAVVSWVLVAWGCLRESWAWLSEDSAHAALRDKTTR